MFLTNNDFEFIIRSTPLISIDLIIQNNKDKVLLGQRTNRPARGFWFVPGGRIQKDESVADAYKRLNLSEINLVRTIDLACFSGVYEHFYKDNFFNENSSTHYVVLCYKSRLDQAICDFPLQQHSHYRWFSVDEILSSPLVHSNTKAYFKTDI